MNLVRLGSVLRAVRHRLGWRQSDVARRAAVSASTVSRIERGHAGSLAVDTVARVAAVLEVRLDIVPRWRGGELDRLIGAGHAALHDDVARLLTAHGWTFASEVTFSVFGERGSIDVLAYHSSTGMLLVIELKSQLVDVQELLAAVDRYRRLAPGLADGRGWNVGSIIVWVAMRDTRTNRRRAAAHRDVLRAAFPRDGRLMSRWLRAPAGSVRALSFLPDVHRRNRRRGPPAAQRIRVRRARSAPRSNIAMRSSSAPMARSDTRDHA